LAQTLQTLFRQTIVTNGTLTNSRMPPGAANDDDWQPRTNQWRIRSSPQINRILTSGLFYRSEIWAGSAKYLIAWSFFQQVRPTGFGEIDLSLTPKATHRSQKKAGTDVPAIFF
jgi:hypothetical protein